MTAMTLRFNGSDYDPALDDDRLAKQMGRVFSCMADGKWRSLSEIAAITGDPAASISAQLRHLRKPRFGGYEVQRQRSGNPHLGLFVGINGIGTPETTVRELIDRIERLEATVVGPTEDGR